jgi:hypothetical protein
MIPTTTATAARRPFFIFPISSLHLPESNNLLYAGTEKPIHSKEYGMKESPVLTTFSHLARPFLTTSNRCRCFAVFDKSHS